MDPSPLEVDVQEVIDDVPRDLVPGGGRDVAAGPAVEAGQWTLKAEEAEKEVRTKPVALIQGNIL